MNLPPYIFKGAWKEHPIIVSKGAWTQHLVDDAVAMVDDAAVMAQKWFDSLCLSFIMFEPCHLSLRRKAFPYEMSFPKIYLSSLKSTCHPSVPLDHVLDDYSIVNRWIKRRELNGYNGKLKLRSRSMSAADIAAPTSGSLNMLGGKKVFRIWLVYNSTVGLSATYEWTRLLTDWPKWQFVGRTINGLIHRHPCWWRRTKSLQGSTEVSVVGFVWLRHVKLDNLLVWESSLVQNWVWTHWF